MNTDNQKSREVRSIQGLELREAAEGSGSIGTLVGYAVVYNSDSELIRDSGKPFIERIAPGAFTESLAEETDLRALWDHDASKPIGRRPDTMRVSEDDIGVAVEIDLPDTTTARDLKANVRAKIVDGMSFAFRKIKDSWERRGEFDVRTILKGEIGEVSAVTFQAYPDTSIAVRSLEEFRAQNPDAGDKNEPAQTEGSESASDALSNDELHEPERRLWEIQFGIRKTLPEQGHDT